MDQLATRPGWTGILFLVHDNSQTTRKGRIYTHSYATKGIGQKVESALKDKLFKTMMSFLFGNAS